MADKKITQLTAGTPAATDILPYVADPGGAAETRKANISLIAPLTTKGDVYAFSTENTRLPVGTPGQMIVAATAETTGLKWINRPFGLDLIVGNGQVAVGTGLAGWFEMPYSGSLSSYRLVSDAAGNATIDVYKSAFADIPFGTADSICPGNKVILSGAQTKYDGTLSSWTKTFSAGDWIGINVDAAGTIKQATLSLRGVITDEA